MYAVLRPKSPLIERLDQLPKKNITTLALRNSLDAQSARHLASIVRKNEIQIVHAHMARDYPLAAYASALSRVARFVITRHVLFPLNRFHRFTLAQVSRVIAVSEAVELQLRAERVVPAERIAVVHNGVDVDRFQRILDRFDRAQFLRTWKLPETALLIGTVGELKPLKGQEEFLRAAARVAPLIRNARFIVAGVDTSRTQEHRQRLERLIDELQLRSRVLLIDWVTDIAELYCALDIFVSASRAESFGLAMAEAMASHTAVVATSTEGAKTIIDSNNTGVLVPIGNDCAIADAVLSLLQDESRRTELGNLAARSVRDRFGLDRMVEATERVYEEILRE
jgi:glycosyltransferase involved in cell wall biosynthesis